MRSTARPLRRSATRSPVACARCTWPSVYGLPGTGMSSGMALVSWQYKPTSVGVCHDGGTVGFVGVPHLVGKPPFSTMFDRNVGLRGGVAPVRTYIPLLLRDVLDGELRPGRVFDRTFPLHAVGSAYAAMHSREVLKAMLVP